MLCVQDRDIEWQGVRALQDLPDAVCPVGIADGLPESRTADTNPVPLPAGVENGDPAQIAADRRIGVKVVTEVKDLEQQLQG